MSKSEILADILREGGSVCLTGEMPECDRIEFMNVASAVGLTLQMTPSKRLSFLLVADGARQNKIDRATELGVPVFSAEDFWNAVDLVYPPAEQ